MSDRVRMTSKTVFQNERVTVFREGGPFEGETGIPATMGDQFETDLTHAKELDRLGLAEPLNRADLDGEPAPLEAHYQVSATDLRADQAARAVSSGILSGGTNLNLSGSAGDTGSLNGLDLTPKPVADNLDSKTNAELREIAAAEAIDLGDAKRKDEILAAIRAARTGKEG